MYSYIYSFFGNSFKVVILLTVNSYIFSFFKEIMGPDVSPLGCRIPESAHKFRFSLRVENNKMSAFFLTHVTC
jgi:hypothetical protein